MSSGLVDAHGRPVSSMTVEQLAQAVQNDMGQVIRMVQMMQQGLMLSEMKSNFLIKKLTEAGILGETLDTEWNDFVKLEYEKMRKELEAKELSVVGDASKLVGQPNKLFEV